MPDREKVIKGLEHCIPDPNKSLSERMEENECRHAECPYGGKEYERGMGCFWSLMSDALSLLKEQDAKPVKIVKNAYNYKFYYCPNCNRPFYGFYNKHVYCDRCGQAVKWE